MSSDAYQFPVAISRLTEGETSREPQNSRAVQWLADQPGGSIVIVTPQKQIPSDVLKRLAAQSGVTHLSWKGFSTGALVGHRALYAWPNQKHLNVLWGVQADALVVIEWSEEETAEWIEEANPVQLFHRCSVEPQPAEEPTDRQQKPLPNGVDGILEHIAAMAAGYSSGLKWNEEDKLKADMMNRPERWAPITVEQVRTTCRALGMRPDDVDTVAGLLQRRKEGRRFNVQSSYRTFHFN
jgi:hypothetical protein